MCVLWVYLCIIVCLCFCVNVCDHDVCDSRGVCDYFDKCVCVLCLTCWYVCLGCCVGLCDVCWL